jgi:hypothetical protein
MRHHFAPGATKNVRPKGLVGIQASGKSRMREYFKYGSVRGAAGNGRPYPRSPGPPW